MPESLVVSVMRQNKAALLAREQVQMQAMAQRWLQVEQALDAQINALAEEFARLARDGVTQGQLVAAVIMALGQTVDWQIADVALYTWTVRDGAGTWHIT